MHIYTTFEWPLYDLDDPFTWLERHKLVGLVVQAIVAIE